MNYDVAILPLNIPAVSPISGRHRYVLFLFRRVRYAKCGIQFGISYGDIDHYGKGQPGEGSPGRVWRAVWTNPARRGSSPAAGRARGGQCRMEELVLRRPQTEWALSDAAGCRGKGPLREAAEALVDARFWRSARPWGWSIFVGAGLGGGQSIEDAGDDVRGVDRFAVLLVAALRDSAFGVNGIAFPDVFSSPFGDFLFQNGDGHPIGSLFFSRFSVGPNAVGRDADFRDLAAVEGFGVGAGVATNDKEVGAAHVLVLQ